MLDETMCEFEKTFCQQIVKNSNKLEKNRIKGTWTTLCASYEQPIRQNGLYEAVGCFVLLLVLPGSVEINTVSLFFQ